MLKSPKLVGPTFKTASGEIIKSKGLYNISLEFLNNHRFPHPFYVIPNLNERCIIGLDFLTLHSITINPTLRTLSYLHNGKLFNIDIPIPNRRIMNIFKIIPERKFILDHLSSEKQLLLLDCLTKHQSLFAENMSEMRMANVVKHAINLKGEPVNLKMRRTPNSLKPIIKSKIDEMLTHNIIRESTSPFASPIVIVPKKGGEMRFCIDYRKLNDITIKDRYPLPRIDDTIDSLSGAKLFSTLDLFSGYWQIEIEPLDQHKTSFICEFGQFEFVRMPFGLTNAPATFQRFMNHIFRKHLNLFVLVYLDDIIIFSRSIEDHVNHLNEVFKILKEAGLRLKLSKCHFAKNQINYLGHVISDQGVAPDPNKTSSIANFPQPRNVKELQSFLGLANYYRKYIKAFAEKAHPLTTLTRKNYQWNWGDEQARAFNCIKDSLLTKPILGYPDFSKEFIVHTDASNFGVGAVLSQLQRPLHSADDSHEVAIAYASKHLTETQMKWSTTEKEAYAIIHGVSAFRPYLYGTKFLVITDHRALQWLMSKSESTGRLARWALKLQEYNIEIGYRAGKNHQNADSLSRRPKNIISTVFSVIDDWKEAQTRDEYCAEILTKLNNKDESVRQYDFNFSKNGLLSTLDGKIVVPLCKKKEILELNHDHKLAGHLGITKTLKRIRDRYFWPSAETDITNYIKNCLICNKRKALNKCNKAPMQPIKVTNKIWHTLAMDIVGPITESYNGNKYILVVSEYTTRYVMTMAMENQTAKTVAKHFVYEVLLKYGAPENVLTDQGRNFLSSLISEICVQFNIKQIRTTAYHPQTDGLVERFNRTMVDMLATFVHNNPEKWDEYLPFITLAYNSSIHTSTKYSPFYLLFGREPSLATDLDTPLRYRAIEDENNVISQQWHEALKIANSNLANAQKGQKTYYDRNSSEKTYNLNDKVLLKLHEIPGKFNMKWDGPFKIIEKISKLNYRILNEQNKQSSIVHVNRLKLWKKFDESQIPFCTENQEIDTNIVGKNRSLRKRGRPFKSTVPVATTSLNDSTSIPQVNSKRRGRLKKFPSNISSNDQNLNYENIPDNKEVKKYNLRKNIRSPNRY